MASKNAVSLIGYLGADPEIRYMPNGDPVAQISVGTTEAWKDRGSGELKERTEWHRVIVYGKNVVEKYIQPYAKKGSAVAVDGRLRTRKWEKDGIDRYTTEIISTDFQLLDRKQTNGQPAPAPGEPSDDVPF
ncbi:single-stranded DNA-binding protein [Burkholderia multivorans]|uniref:single-stranded DNA-binding protein n=1 Tax=Burkholderia multivorans TaxID=87883 RepID=UPI00158CCF85|nr:single-stranded DNA-binding protein [Burkholderia multivorans]CAJ4328354.1 single-strand binding protein [Burkholderia pseudomallei]MDR8878067.1 Single-stranded DNA-binding protein [Burkholderia multivorans]MDR8882435.1 Single-stranded DNA-binding protein [Burkholderia multivorans]MDR8889505.1 Single-stranded DNA-binding protein [Burkholderia multivorans]MDR8908258.1 Single-stranded DNA-binding protein [Burkholderia multivorans]